MRPPTPDELALYELAEAARAYAHAPYSGIRVGAALRLTDGSVVQGANVENASYGLTCCAERVAAFTAVAAGGTAFDAVAVHAGELGASPCGACRQVLAEFAADMPVVFTSEGAPVTAMLSELLPVRFGL